METDDKNTTCIALSGHKTMTTDLKPNYDSEVCTSHVERKKSITVLIRKDEANNLQLDKEDTRRGNLNTDCESVNLVERYLDSL